MIDLNQTKLNVLTMLLNVKANNYKKLCDELDELVKKQIDPNDERLLVLKELFKENYDDIVKINKQIKKFKKTIKL